MATKQSELIVRIGANADKFDKELKRVGKTTANLEKQLASVAKISGVAFAAGAAAIASATVAAGKFEDKFTNVVTLLDKGSFSTMTLEQGIDSLKKGVIELGQETGESFDDLNKALFDLISSGVPAEEAIDTLRVTTELAAAGATDTATAVQALTATMTSFGDAAGTANEISEKFFTAQKFGVTTVGELASEFSKVAGTANALGISFDETLASLSALTADGAKPTNVAATQLKAAFTSIINVQKDLKKESAAVQDALDLQNVKQRGLVATLDLLKKATGGNVSEMQRLLGSAESLSVALSLTGAQSELVAKQVREMGDEQKRSAVFADALATKQENSRRAFERFARVIETGAIVLGDQFAPILARVAELFGAFFKILVNNPVLAKTTALILGAGTAFAGLAAALSVGAIAFLNIRKAMIAMNVTTRVLSLSVKGLVGATGIGLLLIVANEILNNWETVWPATVKIFQATVKTLMNLAGGIGNILKGIFTLDSDAISKGMDQARDAIKKGLDDVIAATKNNEEKKTMAEKDGQQERETNRKIANEKEIQDIAAKSEKIKDMIKQNNEEKLAFEEEFKSLTKEQQALFNEEKIEEMQEQILTEQEIEQMEAERKLKAQIDRRNKYLQDEKAHGAFIAKLEMTLASERVKLAKQSANELVQLTRSKTDALKAIGKGAAVAQIAIDTAQGAASIFAKLNALVPIAAPAIGAAGAGAIIAFGAEKTANVLAANTGGLVPTNMGIPGTDSVNALLTPGELVVPEQNFDEVVGAVSAARRVTNVTQEIDPSENEMVFKFQIEPKGELVEMIEQQIIERRVQGIGKL